MEMYGTWFSSDWGCWERNCPQDWHGAGTEKTDIGVKFINPAVLGNLLIFRVAESR